MGHTLFPEIPDFPRLIACVVPVKGKIKTAEAVENTAFPAVLSLVGMTGFEPAAFASRTL